MSRSSNTPATPVSNPASAQGVEPSSFLWTDELYAACDALGIPVHFATMDKLVILWRGITTAAQFPASPAPSRDAAVPASGGVEAVAEERQIGDQWRKLALQFDRHRIAAMTLLRSVAEGDASAEDCKRFVALPPPPASLSPAPTSGSEARLHAVDLEQCSLFVDSAPIVKAMTDAAKFLRALAKPASEPAGGGLALPTQRQMNEAFYVDVCRAEDRLKQFIVASGALLDSLPARWHGENEDELRELCKETDAILNPHRHPEKFVAIARKRYGVAALSSAPATPSPAEAEAKEGRADA